MSKLIDLTGRIFGRLTVIRRIPHPKGRQIKWECKCSCQANRTVVVIGNNLKRGITRSCGCLWEESITKHGKAGSPEYTVWESMINRCECQSSPEYHNYGQRGIRLCRRWRESFSAFLEDMGERPTASHQIDRINNNWGYWCGKCSDCRQREIVECNCRWVTRKQNARNKRNTMFVDFQGERISTPDLAERVGMSGSILLKRLQTGWSVEEAVTGERQPRGKRLTHEGKTLSWSAWAKKTGIAYATINKRASLGWSDAEILTIPLGQKREKEYTHRTNNHLISYNGETLHIAAWAKKTGLSRKTIENRVKLGWSPEKTLTVPPRPRRKSNDRTVTTTLVRPFPVGPVDCRTGA